MGSGPAQESTCFQVCTQSGGWSGQICDTIAQQGEYTSNGNNMVGQDLFCGSFSQHGVEQTLVLVLQMNPHSSMALGGKLIVRSDNQYVRGATLLNSHRQKAKAIAFIKTQWRLGLSLKEIAQRHKIDPGNLAREFRNREGKTFKQFLNEQRKHCVLEKIAGDKTFGYHIASELGFVSDLAFYHWVKRSFGFSYHGLLRQLRSDHRSNRTLSETMTRKGDKR